MPLKTQGPKEGNGRPGLTICHSRPTSTSVRPFITFIMASTLFLHGRTLGADESKPQTFDSKGVAISYTVEGKGEPVVLIHGLYASAQLNWRAPGIIKI